MTPGKDKRTRRKAGQDARRWKRQRAAHGADERMHEGLPVDPTRLTKRHVEAVPEFLALGRYRDIALACADCGSEDVWTASQQKQWYEAAKQPLDSQETRCRACAKAHARNLHFAAVLRKYGSLESVLPRPRREDSDARGKTSERGKGGDRRRKKLNRREVDWKSEPPGDDLAAADG